MYAGFLQMRISRTLTSLRHQYGNDCTAIAEFMRTRWPGWLPLRPQMGLRKRSYWGRHYGIRRRYRASGLDTVYTTRYVCWRQCLRYVNDSVAIAEISPLTTPMGPLKMPANTSMHTFAAYAYIPVRGCGARWCLALQAWRYVRNIPLFNICGAVCKWVNHALTTPFTTFSAFYGCIYHTFTPYLLHRQDPCINAHLPSRQTWYYSSVRV